MADISQAAVDYGLYVDPGMTKLEIWAQIEDYIQKNVIPTTWVMARRAGH